MATFIRWATFIKFKEISHDYVYLRPTFIQYSRVTNLIYFIMYVNTMTESRHNRAIYESQI